MDEAGRGPLAGPIVVAAVRLPAGPLPPFMDSKKLTASLRGQMAAWIRENAEVAVEFVPPVQVDAENVLQASLNGMARAAHCLTGWRTAWVDGPYAPAALAGRAQPVIRGDGLILEIAAASIVAKVARDAYMTELADRFPGYGFERHFGYPTAAHLAALDRLGPCPEHRRTFAAVKRLLTT